MNSPHLNKSPHERMREAGPRGYYISALIITLGIGAILWLYNISGQPLGEVISTTNVVPAVGVSGYTAEATLAFCNDKTTTIRPFPKPDATGQTWQLTRDKDNRTETIVILVNFDFDSRGQIINKDIQPGTHYYWGNVVQPDGTIKIDQVSEPAQTNNQVLSCLEEKLPK